jgi:hypothetical protein
MRRGWLSAATFDAALTRITVQIGNPNALASVIWSLLPITRPPGSASNSRLRHVLRAPADVSVITGAA